MGERMRFLLGLSLLASLFITGCGSKGGGSVVDGADAQKIAEYEKMVKENEALMEASQGKK